MKNRVKWVEGARKIARIYELQRRHGCINICLLGFVRRRKKEQKRSFLRPTYKNTNYLWKFYSFIQFSIDHSILFTFNWKKTRRTNIKKCTSLQNMYGKKKILVLRILLKVHNTFDAYGFLNAHNRLLYVFEFSKCTGRMTTNHYEHEEVEFICLLLLSSFFQCYFLFVFTQHGYACICRSMYMRDLLFCPSLLVCVCIRVYERMCHLANWKIFKRKKSLRCFCCYHYIDARNEELRKKQT